MERERIARLAKTPLVIDGVTYNLCGDFAALVEAEAFFNLRGHGVDLVSAIWTSRDAQSGLSALRQLLPCALHTFHAKLGFEEAQAMIDRMIARDDPSFVAAIGRMWPTATAETEEANRNLCFELDSLAEAAEFFGGEAGLSLLCVDGPITLEHVYRTFPCAVHRFRPELSLDEARQLMTLPSLFLVIGGLDQVRRAPKKQQEKFVERVGAAASEEEKQDILFRIMAKMPWAGAAQA